MGILAAFVGSALLVPHPFDQLRPPEKERAQVTLSAELEVDARLWEDSFAAMRRYEAKCWANERSTPLASNAR
jgi:hypothetical protein